MRLTPRQVLGVPEDASFDDCKKAYRRLCYECHPDKTGNDPEKTERFKAINQAWAELENPELAKPIEEREPPSAFTRGFSDIFSETMKRRVMRDSPEETIFNVINLARDPASILGDLAEEVDQRGGLAGLVNTIFGKKTER